MVIVASLVLLIACTKSTNNVSRAVDCSGVVKSFSTDVNPIIQSNCATNSGCHGSGSTNGPGELLTYSEISNAKSAIRSAVISGTMPKNGSLTTAQINSIACWIDNGASNN
jgi:hypothetical protein